MEVPCPECPGWMRLEGRRLRCPECGAQGDEEVEPAVEAAPAPAAAPAQAPAAKVPGPVPLRRFGNSFFLGVFTLGIYYLYYQYQVFREVDRDAGRRHHAGLFWSSLLVLAAGILLAILWASENPRTPMPRAFDLVAPAAIGLRAAYLWLEADRLLSSCRGVGVAAAVPRTALPAITAAAGFAAVFADGHDLQILLLAPLTVAEVFAYSVLHQAIHGYWVARRGGAPPPASPAPAAPA